MISRGEVENAGRRGKRRSGQQENTTRIVDMFDIYVDPDDRSITPHLVEDGFWESWITTWVLNNIKPGSNCIDVGANQGYYTFLLASRECSVIAVEPINKYIELMKQSAEIHPRGADVHFFEGLAGDKDKMETFYELDGLVGSSSIYKSDHPSFKIKNTTAVKMTTLDQITVGQKVDFIKIDAEGAEGRVWAGMKNLRLNNPQVVTLMEFTPSELNKNLAKELVVNWDTRLVDFDGRERIVESAEWLNVQPDFVMLVIRSRG